MTRNQNILGALIGQAGYLSGASALVDVTRRALKQRRSAAALNRLSDAWLTDLGMTRAAIPAVAQAAALAAVPTRMSLPGKLYRHLARNQARRSTYRELSKLDERMLTDIGIEAASLYNVAGIVGLPKKIMAETAPAATLGHWKDLGLQRLSAAKIAALDFSVARPANSQAQRQAA